MSSTVPVEWKFKNQNPKNAILKQEEKMKMKMKMTKKMLEQQPVPQDGGQLFAGRNDEDVDMLIPIPSLSADETAFCSTPVGSAVAHATLASTGQLMTPGYVYDTAGDPGDICDALLPFEPATGNAAVFGNVTRDASEPPFSLLNPVDEWSPSVASPISLCSTSLPSDDFHPGGYDGMDFEWGISGLMRGVADREGNDRLAAPASKQHARIPYVAELAPILGKDAPMFEKPHREPATEFFQKRMGLMNDDNQQDDRPPFFFWISVLLQMPDTSVFCVSQNEEQPGIVDVMHKSLLDIMHPCRCRAWSNAVNLVRLDLLEFAEYINHHVRHRNWVHYTGSADFRFDL
eukprot:ANDGO_05956.mRNA.1 hypothetical protein